MANDFKRGIRVYLETSDYGKGIDAMVASTKKYETELAELTEESKKMTAEGKNSGKAWDDLNKKITAHEKQLVKSKTTEADYRAKLEQTKKVLNNLSGASYNDLISVQKQLQKEVKKGSDTIEEHNQKLEQLKVVNRQVGISQTEMNSKIGAGVGGVSGFAEKMSNLPGIMGYAGSSLIGFGGLIKTFLLSPTMIAITAIVGLVAGLFSLAKNSMEFGKAVSNLSALTGATGKDLDFLKDKAKNLAKVYGQSAVEIVEAMKLVGSAKPELLNNVQALSDMTANVLTLSKATGMDLGDTTKSLTTIMNQFGLSALEGDRAINVLAAGSKYGAVEVDYLGESIVKVGTIAKSAGLSLETTTAAMELFGYNGIKAEVAGTGFKSVLVDLQSDTKNYTNGLFDLNKAIDNNQNISNDNIALQKKFGKEFFGVAQILFQNKDMFNQLTTQITNTTVAEEQMRIATDNLSGDTDKMKSSWNAFTLSLEDGQGPISTTFRSLIQWATDAVNVLGLLTKSAGQKEADLVAESANRRIKSLKEDMSLSKDKVGVIDNAITAEQHIYERNNEKIKKLKAELIENDKKNFLMHSTILEAENKKEIESLQKHVNRSIAFVNAAAGLRSGVRQSEKPASGDANGSSGGKGDKKLTDEEKKKRAEEAKKLAENQAKAREKLIGDTQLQIDIETKAHNDRLKAVNLFEMDMTKMSSDQLDERTRLEELFYKNIANIATTAENKRFEDAKKEAGVDTKDPSKLKGEKLKAYELLMAQHQLNLTKITEDGEKKRETFEKSVETAILSSIQTANASELKTIESTKNAKLQAAKTEYANGILNKEQYDDKIDEINTAALNAQLKAQQIFHDLLLGLEMAATPEYIAALQVSRKAVADTQAEIDDQKLKKEEKFQKNKTKLVSKYAKDTLLGEYKERKEALDKAYSEGLISEKEYQRKLLALKLNAARQYTDEVGSVVQAGSDFVNALQGAETASVQADYQQRLAGLNQSDADYAQKKEQLQYEQAVAELDVQKKYADAQFGMQIAQIGVAAATGIMNAWASSMILGPVLGPIAAGAMTLLIGATSIAQIASASSERDKIKSTTIESPASGGDSGSSSTGARVVTAPQAAKGRWDVIGEEDGKLYRNVPYTGVARTGIVTQPTLVGEEPEIVIDNPTTRNIIMNAPWLLGEIKRHRVPQRASGKYDAVNNAAQGDNSTLSPQDYADLIAMVMMVIKNNTELMQYLKDNGVIAPIVLTQLDAAYALRDKSVKKGSLKS